MSEQYTFLLEEYKALRTEIESYSNQKKQLEIYVVTAIFVIYGWASNFNGSNLLKDFAIFSPILLVLFGIYRFYFYNTVISKQADYIRNNIESKFLPGETIGWESFWKTSKKLPILRWGEYLFWCFLLLITIFTPLLY